MWKTQNGRVLRIVDMDDRHLGNAIRMLEGQGRGKAALEFYEENELSEIKMNEATEDQIVVYMEWKLSGVLPDWLEKYRELIEERERRRCLASNG